jgi:rfaE bifunctional protein kinase chain/domain
MREKLLNTLDLFPSRNIVVVGDLIADEFLYGSISRVSREAPVLVLEYQTLHRLPGGAANAANNLLALDCKTAIAGIVGQDEPGAGLIYDLRTKGADIKNIKVLTAYSTPVKTRILAGAHHSSPQQIVRVDVVPDAIDQKKITWRQLKKRAASADGIIISDYGYGAITPGLVDELQQIALKKQIPIVVDSRFRMSAFKNVTSITPNITELEACQGVTIGSDAELLQKIGSKVLRAQKLKALLVTQGRFGMTLFEAKKKPLHIPVFGTDEVADVTGAGDTVIAVFTLCLACGVEPQIAARLANYAGGIVVMKRGTATVTRAELKEAVLKDCS